MTKTTYVLFSGGLESGVLVGMLAEHAEVFPFRVHYGLRWEAEEHAAGERFLAALHARHSLHIGSRRVLPADPCRDFYWLPKSVYACPAKLARGEVWFEPKVREGVRYLHGTILAWVAHLA